MNDSALRGFDYRVSDEQLRAYMALPLIARLQWLEEARRFTLAGQTRETRARMERLRAAGAQR